MMETNAQQMAATQRTMATRQSWTNLPLPEQRTLFSFQREFTAEEYEVIRYGLIPEAMEDKWFIFLEEDVLYFHRSWTGYCIYQLRLTKAGANYAVAEAFVNRDPSQYSSTDDEYDEELLTWVIDNLLLGRSSMFPVPAGVPAGIATGLYHHSVAGVRPRARETPASISLLGVLGWLWAWLKFLIRR
jgi:hypothetical protein